MRERILLCEWDAQELRKKLAYWESLGYQPVLSRFKKESDTDLMTGKTCVTYSIDLEKPKAKRPGVSHGKGH